MMKVLNGTLTLGHRPRLEKIREMALGNVGGEE